MAAPHAVTLRRLAPVQVTAIVLAAALVFAAAIAVVEWRKYDNVEHTDSVRNQAAATAAALGQALLTYSYTDLGASQARIQNLSTGTFAAQEAADAAASESSLASAKATGEATVEQVSVTGAGGGKATALVTVKSSVHAATGSASALEYFNMNLLLVKGHWKVDALQRLTPAPS